MVMNKHGFLRILEAIIAIIIILGFVIAIVPQRLLGDANIPPDLDETMNSILKEMQDNPNFRICVLGGSAEYDFNNNRNNVRRSGAECVYSYIGFLTTPTNVHPWDYAVRICEINRATQQTIDCNYRLPNPQINQNDPLATKEMNFGNRLANTGTDVYLKSTTLSLPDVSGEDPDRTRDPNLVIGNYNSLTIYAWSKS